MGAEPIVFAKVCGRRKCSKAFTTTARHQQFCQLACGVAARREQKKPRKYDRERHLLVAASIGRQQARKMQTERLPAWCQRCGTKMTWRDLDVHHIDGNPNNNPADGANHANLCATVCHPAADAEMRAARAAGVAPPDPRRFATDGTPLGR